MAIEALELPAADYVKVLKINEIAEAVNSGGRKVQHLTSSPTSPGPDIDLSADTVLITSSGSGGLEWFNVPGPSSPWPDDLAGHLVLVRFAVATNPADLVTFQIDGQTGGGVALSSVGFQTGIVNQMGLPDALILAADQPESIAAFRVQEGSVAFDMDIANNNYHGGTVQVPDTTFGGGSGWAFGDGSRTAITTFAGADALGGSGLAGGDAVLTGGAGDGAGARGHLKILNLPTADPHVAGALWTNAGALMVSAG